jgi:hypothetical protein
VGRGGGTVAEGLGWLAGGKVLPVSSWRPLGGHRATRAEAGLTQTMARRWVVGRRCAVAFGGGGASTVVADNAAQVPHHGERGRKVRWGPRKVGQGATSGSSVKADGGGVSEEIG